MRYFVEIAYNGKKYHGWQIQPNASTVQQEINKAFSVLFRKEKFECVGCGRTDTGVHAKQFYFHFDTEEAFNEELYVYKLNSILPSDILVKRFISVKEDAHSRFDAESRTYQYFIHQHKEIFNKDFSCFYPKELDIDNMNEAAAYLLEVEDFTSFSKLHSNNKTNRCKVFHAIWTKENNQLKFEIKADRFLRNMVRAIVGTCVEVGSGSLTLEDFKRIVAAKDRCEAGKSFDGKALFLTGVEYPYVED